MNKAGEDSPHLDDREQAQAAEGTPIGPLVIHEIVRGQGETELERSFGGLAWSGLAAGIAISNSLVAEGALYQHLPDSPWRELITGFGYSVGFLIVILGRLQLFTEHTVVAVMPVIAAPSAGNFAKLARLWGIVLGTNQLGTFIAAFCCLHFGLTSPELTAGMIGVSRHLLDRDRVRIDVEGHRLTPSELAWRAASDARFDDAVPLFDGLGRAHVGVDLSVDAAVVTHAGGLLRRGRAIRLDRP